MEYTTPTRLSTSGVPQRALVIAAAKTLDVAEIKRLRAIENDLQAAWQILLYDDQRIRKELAGANRARG